MCVLALLSVVELTQNFGRYSCHSKSLKMQMSSNASYTFCFVRIIFYLSVVSPDPELPVNCFGFYRWCAASECAVSQSRPSTTGVTSERASTARDDRDTPTIFACRNFGAADNSNELLPLLIYFKCERTTSTTHSDNF